MTDSTIGIDEPSAIDKLLDTESLVVGGNTVHRERGQIAGKNATEIAEVKNTEPGASDNALAVRNIPGTTPTPVSASSLPLPTGAATGAKQDTGNTSLSSIDGKLPATVASSAKQDTGNTSLSSIDGKTPALVGGRVPVDGSGVTQPISATTLPLPTGASTGAKQDTGNTSLNSIDGKIASGTGVPAVADPGIAMRPVFVDRAATAVLSALDPTGALAAVIDLDGMAGAGCYITASSLVGTLVAELSADGGTTWSNTSLLNHGTVGWSFSGLVNPTVGDYTALVSGPARKLRIRCSNYLSGSATVVVVASALVSPLALAPTLSIAGVTSPVFAGAVVGVDIAGIARNFLFRNATPASTDYLLGVRDPLTASLDAKLGAVDSVPGTYTVLDRLAQLGLKLDAANKTRATEATLKQALAALQGRLAAPRVASTLLHRS